MLSWLDLRIITLDLGLRYYVRLQIYAAFYIVVYIILGAIFIVYFFGANIRWFFTTQWIPIIFEI